MDPLKRLQAGTGLAKPLVHLSDRCSRCLRFPFSCRRAFEHFRDCGFEFLLFLIAARVLLAKVLDFCCQMFDLVRSLDVCGRRPLALRGAGLAALIQHCPAPVQVVQLTLDRERCRRQVRLLAVPGCLRVPRSR